MKYLAIYILLAVSPMSFFSQCCPYIDSVVIIPEVPNTMEDTKVIMTVTTPNQGSFLNVMTEVETNNIMINACYYSGFLTALQTYIDTVNLGLLSEGEYNLEFTATQSDNPEFCNSTDFETVLDSFVVGVLDNIVELDEVELIMFPNPNNTGKILFETTDDIVKVEIYNVNGKLINEVVSQNNNAIKELDVTYFSNEIYFLHIYLSDGGRIIKELIRQ